MHVFRVTYKPVDGSEQTAIVIAQFFDSVPVAAFKLNFGEVRKIELLNFYPERVHIFDGNEK
jgi:hypothetical protein